MSTKNTTKNEETKIMDKSINQIKDDVTKKAKDTYKKTKKIINTGIKKTATFVKNNPEVVIGGAALLVTGIVIGAVLDD